MGVLWPVAKASCPQQGWRTPVPLTRKLPTCFSRAWTCSCVCDGLSSPAAPSPVLYETSLVVR